MAITTIGDIKVYQNEFNAGVIEAQQQNIDVFNSSSLGTITLTTERMRGQYKKDAFWKDIDVISRRDVTSSASATPIKMTQDELVSVKVARKFGPVDSQIEPFRMMDQDAERELAFLMGFKYQEKKTEEQVNTSLAVIAAGLGNISAVTVDGTAGTITPTLLSNSMAKFGDKASAIKLWVMHSKVYFDLVNQQIADKITNIADVVLYGGSPASFNRPILVTDSADLIVTGSPNTYITLGLTEGALGLTETGSETFATDLNLGDENLFYRMQGEYNYVIGQKGLAWDVTNGGGNPSDAALVTGSNWDQVVSDVKQLGGVVLKTQ